MASSINVIYQSMPNLHHLNVQILNGLINGNQWEHSIRTYLLKLKIFRLKMEKILFSNQNSQQETDALYKSFLTPFWINEHK